MCALKLVPERCVCVSKVNPSPKIKTIKKTTLIQTLTIPGAEERIRLSTGRARIDHVLILILALRCRATGLAATGLGAFVRAPCLFNCNIGKINFFVFDNFEIVLKI